MVGRWVRVVVMEVEKGGLVWDVKFIECDDGWIFMEGSSEGDSFKWFREGGGRGEG